MELRRLSKELLAATGTAQEIFFGQHYEIKATAGLSYVCEKAGIK